MLYFNLENGYESFKEKFGIHKTTDGRKVRREKVTLNILKDMFRNKNTQPFFWNMYFVFKRSEQPMTQDDVIRIGRDISACSTFNFLNRNIADKCWNLQSYVYRIDGNGLCYDGDKKSIRYEKDGRIYKMKAAKLYGKIFNEHELGRFLGERAQIFCGEKFAEDWAAFAELNSNDDKYTLHVGDEFSDFEGIYSVGGMDSCMTGEEQFGFYFHSVNASAAWLEDEDGEIVCRCVIFNKCQQKGTENFFRIAERQYAVGDDDKLKSILIAKLYEADRIDLHKRVGAPCNRDGWQKICNKSGKIIENPYFSISCYLYLDDILSYQDTFKEYSMSRRIAQNWGDLEYQLDITNAYLAEEFYDDWAEEYYRGGNEDNVHAYWSSCGRMEEGYVSRVNIDNYFTYCDGGRYEDYYVHDDDVVEIYGLYYCKYDEDYVVWSSYESDYFLLDDVAWCDDIDDYAKDFIVWEDKYYADYSYSDLIGRNIPYCKFEEIEAKYAEEHGYVKNENGEWVLESELEEKVA